MYKIYLVALTMLVCTGGFAQAYLTRFGTGAMTQPAAAIRLPYTTDQVESALTSYLAKKGFGASKSHGFLLFRGVPLDSSNKAGNDLYFVASAPDRKVKDNSLLMLIPARIKQEGSSGPTSDSSMLEPARVFLDGLAPAVASYGIGVQVNDRQEAVRKALKILNDMRDDSTDYENRLRDLNSDLAENKADQTKASTELQNYIGADSEKKYKSQKKLNGLIEKQGSLEKKIRKTGADLADKKLEMIKQQKTVEQLQQQLDAAKRRLN
jgi:hypothetical protein